MTEKLLSALGTVGIIIWYALSLIVYILPFVMIGAPFLLNLVLLAIVYFFPPSTLIFWVWGLIRAIQGEQDFWAILYYVMFAIGFLPFFVSTISDLFNARRKVKQEPAAENEPQDIYHDPSIRVNYRDVVPQEERKEVSLAEDRDDEKMPLLVKVIVICAVVIFVLLILISALSKMS